MHHCSALPATFNSYCHQMRKPRNHAPLLRAACDRAACDLQFLLPSNENTSKTMHHCSALPVTFNSYYSQMRKPRDHAPLLRAACDLQFLLPSNEKTSKPCTTAPRCLRPSIAQTSKPMRKPRKPNVKNLGAACDLQFLLPSNENTSKTMHHCSALPATFNSYCHQMRKPRDHAPRLRAACDLQLLQPFNVKTLENEPLLRAACEYHRQKALIRAGNNWRDFMGSTDIGLQRIKQSASVGAQSDLLDSARWGWSCMLHLRDTDNWERPTTTTWAAEFLLRDGESREFLGSWINSSTVHEAKKRRVKQVITCTFPCGKWLHMIKARPIAGCELCKRIMTREATNGLPTETLAHIQSAGCKSQKKSVIGAHNRCWKYLIGAISTHGEATRNLEFIGRDKDKQLEKLWAETKIGDIFP
jgi:hypothetical protein